MTTGVAIYSWFHCLGADRCDIIETYLASS
jgi:hypothetical protein